MSASLIGGTRASSILNCGFQTPYEVWAEMTGKAQREDIGHLEHIQAGRFMEPAAKAWFTHKTGRTVLPVEGLYTHARFPWLGGTPDGLVADENGKPCAVIEAKNCHGMNAKAWRTGEDEHSSVSIPLGYQIQGQVYAELTGFAVVHFAAIVGGVRLETPQMHRDSEFIAAMLAELERFYVEHVQKDIPPPVTGKDLDVLKRLWPKDSGAVLEFPANSPEDAALCRLLAAKEEEKLAKLAIDEHRATLEAVMKDATELRTPTGRVTWKTQVSERKAQPAMTVESRVFLPKRAKQ